MLNWLRNLLTRNTLKDPAGWLYEALCGGSPTLSGVSVNENTALSYPAVWACIRVLAESVASLPLPVYRRLDVGKERTRQHPVHALLNERPNPEMSGYTLRETLMGHVLTHGNGYAEIVWAGNGRPMALWPIPPDRVTPMRRDDGQLVYRVRQSNEQDVYIPPENMLHLAGLGYDGVMGYSPIRMARQAIGLGIAAENFGAAFFGNSARPSGALEAPAPLSPEARKNLKESFSAAYQGSGNTGRVILLEEGIKFSAISITPEDAQFLETRKFQVTEICRWFRVPPHLVADLERSTYSNIEHQSIDFVVHSLRPWLVRWEQEIARKLFGPNDEYFAEFLVDGLLRGDIKSRYDAYAIARQWGWMSVDDIRAIENMNPLPDGVGQIYLEPLNMKEAGEETPAPPPPAPPAAPPADEEDDDDDEEEPVDDARMDEQLRQRLVRSTKAMLVESTRRMLKRLQTHAAKNSGTDWVATHRDIIHAALDPAVEAYAAASGLPCQPAEAVDRLLDGFVQDLATCGLSRCNELYERVPELFPTQLETRT